MSRLRLKRPTVDLHHLELARHEGGVAALPERLVEGTTVLAPVGAEDPKHRPLRGLGAAERLPQRGVGVGRNVVGAGRGNGQARCQREQENKASCHGIDTRASERIAQPDGRRPSRRQLVADQVAVDRQLHEPERLRISPMATLTPGAA